MSKTDFQFHILGLGAIGGLWYQALFKKGLSVSVWPSNNRKLPEHIEFKSLDKQISKVPVVTSKKVPLEEKDVLLVCVKSYQLSTALESSQLTATEGSKVILFQNGMGHAHCAKDYFSKSRLMVAVSTQGAYRKDQQWIHAGTGQTTIGDALNAQNFNDIPQLLATLNEALPTTQWTNNIQPAQWKKLVINAVINPLTALYECRNGELLTQPAYREHMHSLINELAPLLLRCCPQLQELDLVHLVSQVAQQTQLNVSSMLQDKVAHRPLELESITGFLLQAAKQENLTLPLHSAIYEQLSSLKN
ncbi:ketopantoate reductase family protein [Pleionea litopenaei]|uniref:2-dehydropantoate 2-reductase n=1 Tax=Pleionea litopenaei TaxID=3070815 RepID=A0AA51X6A8_9GAMM|nr:2-dehydropantoate 2-reductase [Pleionea sp. HL-JVS1]WMS86933.1 2-dehydropantoate 2-reductase [Pleionea sp. HL-JVS1]